MTAELFNKIFKESIEKYHVKNDIEQQNPNPYKKETVEHLMFNKSWIDTVQWHLEDIIRDPNIKPEKALEIKRIIDKSNQDRTDLVEDIDDFVFEANKNTEPKPNARINTETPAWAIDRLSILNLKIYHMREETQRTDATEQHIKKTTLKLNVLLQQFEDLSLAINQLLEDLTNGNIIAKTYKQMKMYNDDELNPVLRMAK